MLVRLVCPRPLLFCSIALDASKRKKIVHMVRIQLAWLVECGIFRECLGNNPGGPKWKHRIGRMTYRTYSSGGFPVKKWHCWGRSADSALYQTKTRNFCWCHCCNSQRHKFRCQKHVCFVSWKALVWLHKTVVNEWEENIHFKVLHSCVIDFFSSGPMSHSLCRSWFLDHYINRIH